MIKSGTYISTSCNLCGHKKSKMLYGFDNYSTLKCLNCNLIYIYPFPDKDLIIKIFESIYGQKGGLASFCPDLAGILSDECDKDCNRHKKGDCNCQK